MSENCPNCNQDHDDLRDVLPEFMMLKNAAAKAGEFNPVDAGAAIHTVAEAMVEGNLDRAMAYAQMQGVAPKDAIEGFGASMVKLGFLMGIMTSGFYGDKFGSVQPPSDEEVEAKFAEMEKEREEESERTSKLLAALKQAGVPLPDDLDPSSLRVMVGNMDDIRAAMQQRESASEDSSNDEKPPGLYL